MEALKSGRIHSIDFLRGLVMIIMALDHVRDFFHIDAMVKDPLDIGNTTGWAYFTRWITHYCAPVFVFLSGISAGLAGKSKSIQSRSAFLWKRGLWLILVEFTVVTFGWTFNPGFSVWVMQVIWAIGISMICLGFLIRLPHLWVLIISILILAGHNMLDYPEASLQGSAGLLWDILHHGHFTFYPVSPDHAFVVVYPVLPWIGLMGLGYAMHRLLSDQENQIKHQSLLRYTGIGMMLTFFILRFANSYGDPAPYITQPNTFDTMLSFLNVTKYPPSLMFVCMTIGPALFFLSIPLTFTGKLSGYITTFGKVPFFFYILHIYVIHLLTVIFFYGSGYGQQDIGGSDTLFLFRPNSFGYDLPWVYLIWVLVILICYFPCNWYNKYRSTHKKWWLSYV